MKSDHHNYHNTNTVIGFNNKFLIKIFKFFINNSLTACKTGNIYNNVLRRLFGSWRARGRKHDRAKNISKSRVEEFCSSISVCWSFSFIPPWAEFFAFSPIFQLYVFLPFSSSATATSSSLWVWLTETYHYFNHRIVSSLSKSAKRERTGKSFYGLNLFQC